MVEGGVDVGVEGEEDEGGVRAGEGRGEGKERGRGEVQEVVWGGLFEEGHEFVGEVVELGEGGRAVCDQDVEFVGRFWVFRGGIGTLGVFVFDVE